MSIEAILRGHFFRYSAIQIQDMYKLLHQATLGSGHAISDIEGARKWLERELTEIGSGYDKVAIDPISPDGEIVRVHLHPFIAQGGDSEMLLAAFIRTANEFHGDKTILETFWKIATGMKHFSSDEMDRFIASVRAKQYPAVHHSAVYVSTYHPAYRVICRKFIDE